VISPNFVPFAEYTRPALSIHGPSVEAEGDERICVVLAVADEDDEVDVATATADDDADDGDSPVRRGKTSL